MSTETLKVSIEVVNALKQHAELVFAYNMRDQIAVRGQVAVQKEFPTWLQNYLGDKLEQEAKAINKRIDDKKWNMVVELQKKFGYTFDAAKEQVFGKPLLPQPANVVKAA